MSPSRLRGDAATTSRRRTRRRRGDGDARVPRAVRQRALLRFVAQRAIPGIEPVTARRSAASLRAGALTAEAGWIEASSRAERRRACSCALPRELAPASSRIVARARRWLDLDATPDRIDAALADLPGAPGMRLPGSLDAFELAGARRARAAGHRRRGPHARRVASSSASAAPVATPWPDVQRAPSRIRRRSRRPRSSRSPNSASCARVPTRSSRSRRPGPSSRPRSPTPARRRPWSTRCAALPGHRALDGALHRDARARLARRVSARTTWPC